MNSQQKHTAAEDVAEQAPRKMCVLVCWQSFPGQVVHKICWQRLRLVFLAYSEVQLICSDDRPTARTQPKQVQRLQTKIAAIKRTLAAEKRKFGGYDDSRGLRHLPLGIYLKLGDYKGGLTYSRWFAKNFPDDIGQADFLFEWTVILFKTGHLPQARVKAWQTFCSNTYVLEKYFGRAVAPMDKYEQSNLASPAFADHFTYSHLQPELADFSAWLKELMNSEAFESRSRRYLEIHQNLQHEHDQEQREQLLKEADQLKASI